MFDTPMFLTMLPLIVVVCLIGAAQVLMYQRHLQKVQVITKMNSAAIQQSVDETKRMNAALETILNTLVEKVGEKA